MLDTAKIDISVKALREMTPAQHEALACNVLGEGKWDAHPEVRVRWDAPMGYTGTEAGTIFCQMIGKDGTMTILLGIEPDGYTHS